MKHIDKLHNCKNRLEFLTKYRLFEEKWKKWKLASFCKYFRKQWVESRFSNWCVFNSPIGYTTTNNPIESYNNTIKRFFTNRIKLTLFHVLEVFKSVIQYESSKNEIFQKDLIVTQKLVNKANRIPLTKIKEIKPNKYVYIHQNGKMSNIDLVEKLCSCNTMADKGLYIKEK